MLLWTKVVGYVLEFLPVPSSSNSSCIMDVCCMSSSGHPAVAFHRRASPFLSPFVSPGGAAGGADGLKPGRRTGGGVRRFRERCPAPELAAEEAGGSVCSQKLKEREGEGYGTVCTA
uniref:Uncharacterized protein n=1 Tax=Oryza meridionalis TaxID=40149 RepID=A0A0E0CVG3_9ORYZ